MTNCPNKKVHSSLRFHPKSGDMDKFVVWVIEGIIIKELVVTSFLVLKLCLYSRCFLYQIDTKNQNNLCEKH